MKKEWEKPKIEAIKNITSDFTVGLNAKGCKTDCGPVGFTLSCPRDVK